MDLQMGMRRVVQRNVDMYVLDWIAKFLDPAEKPWTKWYGCGREDIILSWCHSLMGLLNFIYFLNLSSPL